MIPKGIFGRTPTSAARLFGVGRFWRVLKKKRSLFASDGVYSRSGRSAANDFAVLHVSCMGCFPDPGHQGLAQDQWYPSAWGRVQAWY